VLQDDLLGFESNCLPFRVKNVGKLYILLLCALFFAELLGEKCFIGNKSSFLYNPVLSTRILSFEATFFGRLFEALLSLDVSFSFSVELTEMANFLLCALLPIPFLMWVGIFSFSFLIL